MTKGPWTADLLPGDCWRVISADRVIADQIETEADAKLIAAAPRLLAALERVRRDVRDGAHEAVELIETVLSETRGEP